MGGGGGATDIRLSDDSLYSRMIVAGGGSGGAMCYRSATGKTTTNIQDSQFIDGVWVQNDGTVVSNNYRASTDYISITSTDTVKVYSFTSGYGMLNMICYNSSKTYIGYTTLDINKGTMNSQPSSFSGIAYVRFVRYHSNDYGSNTPPRPYIEKTTTSTSNDSQVGYVGGGTTGNGYSDAYKGKQNTAGTNGSFG